MWRIVGNDKVTGKLVDVATADNPTEKEIILRQEARNYDDLRIVSVRALSSSQRMRAQVTA